VGRRASPSTHGLVTDTRAAAGCINSFHVRVECVCVCVWGGGVDLVPTTCGLWEMWRCWFSVDGLEGCRGHNGSLCLAVKPLRINGVKVYTENVDKRQIIMDLQIR